MKTVPRAYTPCTAINLIGPKLWVGLLIASALLFGCNSIQKKSTVPFAQWPILPASISEQSKTILAAGMLAGNKPTVFSKLGDCMTDSDRFLKPLANNMVQWGEFAKLQSTLSRFSSTPARSGKGWVLNSFASPSLAAAGGFNVAGPLDPTWSDPTWCASNESPLECEYRVAKPIISIIMFGTNDVASTDDKTYEKYLRQIVQETMDHHIVPVLSTFPTRAENVARSDQLNQIVVNVASDMSVPLVNLNQALDALPNKGIDPDNSTHLSIPASGRGDDFTSAGLLGGANMRNLLTLQVLELVTRSSH